MSASDGVNVDGHEGHVRDPSLYETLETSEPVPAAEVERQIDGLITQYPHLSRHEALMLLIYRASAKVTMLASGDNGGGRYTRYCRSIGVKF